MEEGSGCKEEEEVLSEIHIEEVETPESKKNQESPGSDKTELNTMGTLTRMDSLGHSGEFKHEE